MHLWRGRREQTAEAWRGGKRGGLFFGEEFVASAEPTSHGHVLYQPVPKQCMALIKRCTVGLFLDQIIRHHAVGC